MFVSHDWADADSIKILSGVKKAMAPHSRLLIRKSYSIFTAKFFLIKAPFRGIHPPTCKPSS